MKAYLKALSVQLLPSVHSIPYILLALIPVIFIYLVFRSKKWASSLVGMLVVLQAMTPITYYPIGGVKGLQPVYLWWALTFLAVIFSRLQSGKALRFGKFFRPPLLFLFFIQALAWARTFTAGPEHLFYVEGFTKSTLFLGYFLNPIQILLTGWMVMVVTEEEQGMVVIKKALMISAIIFGALVTTIYLKTGAQAGGSEQLFTGRFAINDIMGEENNGIAALCVFLFVACVRMKNHGSRLLNIVSIAAILSGILFTLSRMAWINTALITVLLLPKMKWSVRFAVVILFIGLYLHSHTVIVNRLSYGTEMRYASTSEQLNNITADRVTIWQAAWSKIEESPLFGYGIQTGVVMPGGLIADHPHNAYLRILLDMGVIGLMAVIIAYAFMIKISLRKSGILFFSIISLFVMGFVCLEFHPHKQNCLIWIFYGMTLSEVASRARRFVPESKPANGVPCLRIK
jgi:O-antigen ligase